MDFALLTVVLADFIAPLVLCGCAAVFTFFYVKRYYHDMAQDSAWGEQFDKLCPALDEFGLLTGNPKKKRNKK